MTDPQAAAPANVALDQQRNLNTVRLANKTTIRFEDTKVEFGVFGVDRHLMHPIFQWLDYSYRDYGGFAKVTDDRFIGGFRNRLVAGVNILNGSIDNQQFANIGGQKGALLSSSIDRSKNTSLYIEDSFYFLPNVAAIAGTQFLYATRNRQDRFLSNGDQSGATEFNIWSPKAGLLWNIDPTWQAYANISRSAEVPSFGESANVPGVAVIPFTSIRPQTATTYEIGTRMKRPDYAWELTAYRANIRNELQCLYSAFGNCNVTNADRTIHQGIEAGAGAAIFQGIFNNGPAPDKIWLNLAYTFNDFRFDNDPNFGNNLLPGAPRHYLRAELLYKNPTGFYFGPNVEWVPQSYYRRQRQHAEDLSLCAAGIEDGLRQWRADFGLYRGTQSPEQGLHFEHQHHQSGDRHVTLVRTGQRTGSLCRHQVSMVREARYVSPKSLQAVGSQGAQRIVTVAARARSFVVSELSCSGAGSCCERQRQFLHASSHRESDGKRHDLAGACRACRHHHPARDGRRAAADGKGRFGDASGRAIGKRSPDVSGHTWQRRSVVRPDLDEGARALDTGPRHFDLGNRQRQYRVADRDQMIGRGAGGLSTIDPGPL